MSETAAPPPRHAARVIAGRARVGALRDYGIVVAFLALFVTLSLASDVFLTSSNLLNILNQNAAIGIMACGGTLVLIAGGFDLSVGAIYAFAGVITAKAVPDFGPVGAILIGCLVGGGFGVVNGLLSTVGRINSFLTTLATSIMIRGLALAVSGGLLITVVDRDFTTLGRGEVLGVKYAILIWLAFAVVCGFVLTRTVLGSAIFAAGANPEAARLSGVRVNLVRTLCFAVSGLAAGLAGVLLASRVATGQADAGVGVELTVIAAIVIGGTSIAGGAGAIWRTTLGVLLLALIGNGFNLLNVDPTYQEVFKGGIILLAVGIDAWARRTV